MPSAALTLARFGDGWAYRISRPNDATVAILAAPGRRHNTFPAQLATDLELPATGLRRVGRRAAFVQWATRVAAERVLAVGDAALAHDPVSSQGIRFALASALAVAAVIRTWRRSRDDEALAARFYDEFVATERKRHDTFLQSLYGPQFDFGEVLDKAAGEEVSGAVPSPPMPVPATLRFAAQVEAKPLHVRGFIERGNAPPSRASSSSILSFS